MTHDRMVKIIIDSLNEIGASDVRCDLKGYQKPSKIFWVSSDDGHIPDVTAVFKGTRWIFEVETEDSISSEHTRKQLKLFSKFAEKENAVCILAIPKSAYFDALLVAALLKSPVQIMDI